jgi:hypothetical protein
VIGTIIAGAGGLLVLAVLVIALTLVAHIRRAERLSRRPFSRLHQPLPPGPLPMLNTNPDGPQSAPLRSPLRTPDRTSRSDVHPRYDDHRH